VDVSPALAFCAAADGDGRRMDRRLAEAREAGEWKKG
jgi:hypothetical protein